jgi:hypothetical protein
MVLEVDGHEDGFVISNPVPAEVPLKCRSENGPVFQDQQPPRCDGILKVEMMAIQRMLKMADLPTTQCPKCRLAHGFMVRYGTLFYGALL